MDMPKIMMAGFTGLPEAMPFITAAENKKNTQVVIEDWMLGPENPSNEPGANKPYWMGLAKAMQVDEKEARRRRCSNCEYYDNSTYKQALMERIHATTGTPTLVSVASAASSISSVTTCVPAKPGKSATLRWIDR